MRGVIDSRSHRSGLPLVCGFGSQPVILAAVDSVTVARVVLWTLFVAVMGFLLVRRWRSRQQQQAAEEAKRIRREARFEQIRKQRAVIEQETNAKISELMKTLRVSKNRVLGLVAEQARSNGTEGVLEALNDLSDRVERGEQVLVIRTWEQAEEAALDWMTADDRYPGAALTSRGADNGLDIIGKGVAAQVKFRTSSRIGRPDLQQLVGAAGNRQKLFFALSRKYRYSPFTIEAINWAKERSDLALFRMTEDGQISRITTAPTEAERLAFPVDPIPYRNACPICGSKTLVRRNRQDGSRFRGCTAYPSCRYTRSIRST